MAPPEGQSEQMDSQIQSLSSSAAAVSNSAADKTSSTDTGNEVKSILSGNSVQNVWHLAGVRLGRGESDIDILNKMVDKKCEMFIEEFKKTGKPIPPEAEFIIKSNKKRTVYKRRWLFVPVCTTIAGVSTLIYNATYNSAWGVLCSFLFSYIWYDLFSGVLHVLLDNPMLMHFPVLDEPCLEFQWHHHIPQDLVSKSFLEVCGDLNLISMILLSVYLMPAIGGYQLGFAFNTPMALNLVCWKTLMSFFGQLCHSMSHMPPHRRPQWVKNLQESGLMLHPREHAIHHKSYDDNFCVGNGMWSGFITESLRLTNKLHASLGGNEDTNTYCWLAFFCFSFIADVPLANYAFTTYAGFQ